MAYDLSLIKPFTKFDCKKRSHLETGKTVYVINDVKSTIDIIEDSSTCDSHTENIVLVVSRNWFQNILAMMFNKQSIENPLNLCPDLNKFMFESRFKVDFSDITIINEGGYGTVFKARSNLDLRDYAIKQIQYRKNTDKLLREVHLLAKLTHSNVVRYHTAWIESNATSEITKLNSISSSKNSANNNSLVQTSEVCTFTAVYKSTKDLYIQMELCAGDLSQWLDRRRINHREQSRIPQVEVAGASKYDRDVDCLMKDDVVCMARQLIRGVEYIHSSGFMHRDIKPQNIFLNNTVSSGIQIKIGDFGFATSLDAKNTPGKAYSLDIGTPMYVAPELLSSDCSISYDEKCDLYSMGVVLLELMKIFHTQQELVRIFDRRDLDKYRLRIAAFAIELKKEWPVETSTVIDLIDHNPANRPHASSIVSDTNIFRKYPAEFEHLRQMNLDMDAQLAEKTEKITELNQIVCQQQQLIDEMRDQIIRLRASNNY